MTALETMPENCRVVNKPLLAADGQVAVADATQVPLDALAECAAILDATGRILAVNRAWRDFAAAHPAIIPPDGPGANYLSMCDSAPADAGGAEAAFAAGLRAVVAGQRAEFTLTYPCQVGGQRRWLVRRVARFAVGAALRLFVTYEDITERRQAEEALQQANRDLHAALEAKNTMIRNVSHELRTPLTQIIGFTELLVEGVIDGRLTPEQNRSLHVIYNRARALAGLVDALLTLQILSADGLDWRPCDVDALLMDTLFTWEEKARLAHIVLAVDAPPNLPPVHGDYDRLRQMLDQLVDNACKFSGEGGEVTLHARHDGDTVCIAVSDTGVGIAPQQIEHIFAPFYQVDGSKTRKFGGTGIGLTLAREIVALHHGRIWAESAGEGQGATVYVTLPVARPDQSAGGDKRQVE